jgi:hypothetical protein
VFLWALSMGRCRPGTNVSLKSCKTRLHKVITGFGYCYSQSVINQIASEYKEVSVDRNTATETQTLH